MLSTTAVAVGVSVTAGSLAFQGGKYLSDREEMKAGDEEIEAERQRERIEEAILQNQKRPQKWLPHFTHNCDKLLAQVNSASYSGDCDVCNKPITRGWAYLCYDCNYYLHEVCAKDLVALSTCPHSRVKEMHTKPRTPQTTITTFAHKDTVKDVYSNLNFNCRHCFTKGHGHKFRCDACDVDLHPVCATNPTKISSFMHPEHDLELKTRRHFSFCDICDNKEKSNIRMYRCKGCKFYVHPACSQLPQHLMHDLHPPHPLQLRPATSSRKCDGRCDSDCKQGQWCYECKICKVSIHVKCIVRHVVPGSSNETELEQILLFLTMVQKVVEISGGIASIVCKGHLGLSGCI